MNLNENQRASQEQFDRQSERYGRTHILADTSDLDAAVEGVPFPKQGMALDVATGGGHTALWLARRGLRVVLSDVSQRMLEQAMALLEVDGFLAETRQHVAEELPYPGRSFDAVTCRVAAHHFDDPFAFTTEVARVLKPGGWFLLVDGTVPDGESEAARWLNEVERLRDASHVRLLSPSEWGRLCISTGLEVVRSSVSSLLQPSLEWYFDTAATPPDRRERVMKLIAAASDRTREIYRVEQEGGVTRWQWQRIQLVARRRGGGTTLLQSLGGE
jgi:ubiquinone/menaquinone biosynthesis C-methylase UbiE